MPRSSARRGASIPSHPLTPLGKGPEYQIVIFSVGSHLTVSIPCEENLILAKNLPLDGPNPGSSRFQWRDYWDAARQAKHFGLPGLPEANLPLRRKSDFG